METERTAQDVTPPWASRHPILVGLLWVSLSAIFVLIWMKTQGWPVSLLLATDAATALKLIAALVGGALFFGYGMKFWIDRVQPWIRGKPLVAIPVIVLVVGVVAFGDRAAAVFFPPRWKAIEGTGGTMFLDTATIQRNGSKIIVWTKLDYSNWIKRALRRSDFRSRREIDCTRQTMRGLEGGLYKDGQFKYSSEKPSGGPIPVEGYARELYQEVC